MGLLVEPMNTFTNIAFVVAAWHAWIFAKRMGLVSFATRLLCLLSATIFVGSTLFHALATDWARWLDFVPILLFEVCYFYFYLGQMKGLALSAVTIVAVIVTNHWFPGALYGSAVYGQALLAIAALGIRHCLRVRTEPFLLLLAAGVFALSLIFRTVDSVVCPLFPLGTHFLWHLLNGLLLYLLMRAQIVAKQTGATGLAGDH